MTVNEGRTADFSVEAPGDGVLSYQWLRNGEDTEGATSAAYMTVPLLGGDDGVEYACEVSNDSGSVTSEAAAVSVTPLAITELTPCTGLEDGGVYVDVFGTGFDELTTVTFGNQAATSVIYCSNSKLVGVTPALAPPARVQR